MGQTKKQREYLRRTGRPPTVDAAPAVRHVRMLVNRHGMSTQRIADLAGVSASVVVEIYSGRRRSHNRQEVRMMWRSTRSALLSVTPEKPTDRGAKVPDAGARRRLQALAAQGFPGAFVASRLGLPKQIINLLVAEGRKGGWVYWSTANRIAELYSRLDGADPQVAGVPLAQVGRAQAFAARRGYAPPSCWDEDTIDDPDAFAEWTGKCGTVFGWRIHEERNIPACPRCSVFRRGGFGKVSPDVLRASRARLRLTMVQVAERADIGIETYRAWEARWTKPRDWAQLERVLDVLDLTFDEVVEQKEKR